MKKSALYLCALLAGCGQSGAPPAVSTAPNTDNHGFGFEFNFSDPNGLRLRSGNDQPLGQGDFQMLFLQPYLDTEACASISALGPFVVIVAPGSIAPDVGQTFTDSTGLILIDQSVVFDPRVFKHESVHHLLDAAGFDKEANRCHRSPLFLACAGYQPPVC